MVEQQKQSGVDDGAATAMERRQMEQQVGGISAGVDRGGFSGDLKWYMIVN